MANQKHICRGSTPDNFDKSNQFIVAGYKNNRFVTFKTIPCGDENTSCTITGDLDKIKVMVWSSVNKLTPITDAEEIIKNDWILK